MGIDHVGDIIGLQPGPAELTDDVISYLGTDANPSGTLFSHTVDGIGNGLAMHPRIKKQATLRVHDQIARHRHRPWGARGEIRQHAGTIQLQISNAQSINLYHGSPPQVLTRHPTKLQYPP